MGDPINLGVGVVDGRRSLALAACPRACCFMARRISSGGAGCIGRGTLGGCGVTPKSSVPKSTGALTIFMPGPPPPRERALGLCDAVADVLPTTAESSGGSSSGGSCGSAGAATGAVASPLTTAGSLALTTSVGWISIEGSFFSCSERSPSVCKCCDIAPPAPYPVAPFSSKAVYSFLVMVLGVTPMPPPFALPRSSKTTPGDIDMESIILGCCEANLLKESWKPSSLLRAGFATSDLRGCIVVRFLFAGSAPPASA
mmetsp:Transcript_59863/g.110856  ORF Transcript_59863/g.110856 Transcript_59863/m.110856 type:complete len:257 (+) Transcript_59863:240-1010(+)